LIHLEVVLPKDWLDADGMAQRPEAFGEADVVAVIFFQFLGPAGERLGRIAPRLSEPPCEEPFTGRTLTSLQGSAVCGSPVCRMSKLPRPAYA
jgi:hypothetical protein